MGKWGGMRKKVSVFVDISVDQWAVFASSQKIMLMHCDIKVKMTIWEVYESGLELLVVSLNSRCSELQRCKSDCQAWVREEKKNTPLLRGYKISRLALASER